MQVGQRLTGTAGGPQAQVERVTATVVAIDVTPDQYGNDVQVEVSGAGRTAIGRVGELFEGVWVGYVEGDEMCELQLHFA